MIAGIILLVAVGLFLSAFFSGSETGFYRATRLRLILDARSGDTVARLLLWLMNNPSLFVATTLVGNNAANYLVSFAIVMGAQALFHGPGQAAELVAPIVLSPVLFVYGELMPKQLFLNAPNRLLRLGGPLFLAFSVLFFPVAALLWIFNLVLARFLGEAPQEVRLKLARRELRRILEEGHAAGLLHPCQRSLAQGIFSVANVPVRHYAVPVASLPRAKAGMSKEEIFRLARRYRLAVVPVESAGSPTELAGYYRVIDLALDDSPEPGPLHPLVDIPDTVSHLGALMRMRSGGHSLARVVAGEGETLGVVTDERLTEPLWKRGQ
ncbi:MAG: CNNM domain-containing protein [Thermoguttaceae bacterium]|jgi:CBS domain containing-hemolysin-like protein|nr:CNNM domain-containing protein [Thermoguttaceae bacterium]